MLAATTRSRLLRRQPAALERIVARHVVAVLR